MEKPTQEQAVNIQCAAQEVLAGTCELTEALEKYEVGQYVDNVQFIINYERSPDFVAWKAQQDEYNEWCATNGTDIYMDGECGSKEAAEQLAQQLNN